MEVISCHSVSYQYTVKFQGAVGHRSLSSHQTDQTIFRRRHLISSVNKFEFKLWKNCSTDQFPRRKLYSGRSLKSVSCLKGIDHSDPNALSGSYDSYVLDGDEDARNMGGDGKSVPKVAIPGLPDEAKGEYVAPVSSYYWEWKPKLNVHYEKAGSKNFDSPPVLFLPGFGVGSFHYQKQLKDLGRDFRTWALDFLGQGFSLPCEDPTSCMKNDKSESVVQNLLWGFGDESEPWARELAFSIDLWRDQVSYFIKEVIGEPAYLVGNSLGGYVALYFAACHPELVKGVTLLNATPFWGFLPNPIRSPTLSRIFPWAGTFPIPPTVKKITEVVWQKISDPESIAEILKQVYVDHSTNVDEVFSRILEVTKHPAAAASFASIMCAPQGQLAFKEALSRCQVNKIPICLMYGKDDPWVKPIWGLQVKRHLPEAPYYEISPAGHCPHDEVPEVVNYLLRGWIRNVESQGSVELLLLDDPKSFQYNFAKDLEFLREGSKKLVRVQFYGSNSSFWNRIRSFFL